MCSGLPDLPNGTGPYLSLPQKWITLNVTDKPCRNDCSHEVSHKEHGDTRMTAELWIRHDVFGEHQVAVTRCYYWDDPWWGETQWRNANAYVLVDLWWCFRDPGCNIVYPDFTLPSLNGENSELETDWDHDDNFIRAGKTLSGEGDLWVMDDDVHSRHYVNRGGDQLETFLQISFCQ